METVRKYSRKNPFKKKKTLTVYCVSFESRESLGEARNSHMGAQVVGECFHNAVENKIYSKFITAGQESQSLFSTNHMSEKTIQ